MDRATSQARAGSSLIPDAAAYERPLRLSVAAPAFNEAGAIRTVIEGWLDYLRHLDELAEFEIVVCNDGSHDTTGAILDVLAREHHQLHPLHFAVNKGAAVALTKAISATRFDWVLLIDSDGQFPISNLAALLAAVRAQRVPAAIGIRQQKKDRVFARFGSASSSLICNLVHRSAIRDFNSAFKLVWGPLLRALNLEAKGMNYSTELTSRLLESGVGIAQLVIEHKPRTSDATNMKLVRGVVDRLLFVAYIALRQVLLRTGVLRRPLS
jgi:dolichol-phosphate mannosyltransferase